MSHLVSCGWCPITKDYRRRVPGGSGGKESACNAGNPGSIPELGRSPGEGKGNTLQYSYLENSMDRGVAKNWTTNTLTWQKSTEEEMSIMSQIAVKQERIQHSKGNTGLAFSVSQGEPQLKAEIWEGV